MKIIFGVIISYLAGSIPTAYIFGKIYKGIDIREHGSGNVGATNVFRVMGKLPGTIVLLLDIFKGFFAVAIAGDFFGMTEVVHRIILALFVVAGHNWTVFLKFKGGKGIATSLGVLIALAVKISGIMPVFFVTICVWLAFFFVTRIVSLSSIIAAAVLPVSMAVTEQPLEIICLGIVFCIFVVVRHRPNIKRIFSGQEPRVPLFSGKRK